MYFYYMSMNKKIFQSQRILMKITFIDEISPSKRFRLMLNDQKLAIKAIYEEEKYTKDN